MRRARARWLCLLGREVAKFEKLQKAELGTRQKKQPGGREGAVSGRIQGFVVEGRGSRKLPRRERKILPDAVMIVLCAQLSCKSMVGWCLGRRRDEAAETESIENRKSVRPGWTVLGAIRLGEVSTTGGLVEVWSGTG